MPSPIDRRKFLKAAGATAAAGGIALGTAATASASSAKPEINPILISNPIIGIIFLDETMQIGLTDFISLGSGDHVVLATGAPVAGFPALIWGDGGPLTATIPIEPDATLDSVTVHLKGTGAAVTVEVFQQDFSASARYGKYVGDAPVATATGAANAATITASLASGTSSGANTQFQVRVTGLTNSYAMSHATANFKSAAATGFHPVGPIRVYDSRDSGSGGAISSGQKRDVSVANATAFSGSTPNVVPDGARTITYNLTAADPVASGFLAIYAKGGSLKASAINWTPGENVANGGVVNISSDRMVTIEAGGGGSCDFVIDITGYYN